MQPLPIFLWIYAAMIAHSFWEAYVEGRNAWGKGKLGWKIQIGGFTLTAYHFFLFWVMYPLLLTLPFVAYGWDSRLFGIILSAFASGLVLQDFMWFVVNPVVQFKELFSEFTDYYPWVKIGGRKIIPAMYLAGIVVALGSWVFLWR